MARENFTNFATSALSAAISTTTVLSFNVTTGQGALFPSSNFLVVVDTEIMLIASRVADAFTVASGGRGYDGTTAQVHGQSAVVQLSWNRFNVNHLWQNVADTYVPEVPPLQLPGGLPSSFDNEFEGIGNWTLTPSPGGTTVFSAGSAVFSHLVLSRGTNDNSLYTAYIPFALSGMFTVTCKLHDASAFTHASTGDQAQCHLFITDQSNPSASADSGTRFRIDTITSCNLASSGIPTRSVRAAIDTTGTYSQIGPTVPVSPNTPLYLRITYNGFNSYVAYFGDGYAYWQLAWSPSTFGLPAPQSLGLSFYNYTPSNQWMQQVALVDYVRVVAGSILPPYAN